MKFNIKDYKIKYLKSKIKKSPIFFIYNNSNLNSKQQLKLNQTNFSNNLISFKIHNTTTKKLFTHSIFKHLKIIINGSLYFVTFKSKSADSINFLLIQKFNPSLTLLGIKLNKQLSI